LESRIFGFSLKSLKLRFFHQNCETIKNLKLKSQNSFPHISPHPSPLPTERAISPHPNPLPTERARVRVREKGLGDEGYFPFSLGRRG
jgi:hypothetical protein